MVEKKGDWLIDYFMIARWTGKFSEVLRFHMKELKTIAS